MLYTRLLKHVAPETLHEFPVVFDNIQIQLITSLQLDTFKRNAEKNLSVPAFLTLYTGQMFGVFFSCWRFRKISHGSFYAYRVNPWLLPYAPSLLLLSSKTLSRQVSTFVSLQQEISSTFIVFLRQGIFSWHSLTISFKLLIAIL